MSTIVFFPEGAYGPTNNCVGIGDVLRRRGHRVVFIVEESFAGTLEAQGFEERLMRLGPPPEQEEEPGQFWKDFIRETAPVFRKPTIEQLGEFIAPTFQALVDGAKYVDDRLREIIDEVQPDVIVEDNVVSFPALPACGRTWVRIVSCNPAEIKDPDVPPTFSGYPAATRPAGTSSATSTRARTRTCTRNSTRSAATAARPGSRSSSSCTTSPYLNLYLYPDEVDYARAHALDATLAQPAGERPRDRRAVGATARRRPADLPQPRLARLGRRRADAHADRHARRRAGAIVVSKGPQHDQLELRRTWPAPEFLPQVSILPHVDLVITHGGNNTVTESLRFGKPMIVMPMFWDQHDNAQRLDETGFGDPPGHVRARARGAHRRDRAPARRRGAAQPPDGGRGPARRRPRDGDRGRPDRACGSRSSVTRTSRAAAACSRPPASSTCAPRT